MKESKEIKEVEIVFDQVLLGCSDDIKSVYGVPVIKKGKKFIGKCSPEIKKAFLDAGKCDR